MKVSAPASGSVVLSEDAASAVSGLLSITRSEATNDLIFSLAFVAQVVARFIVRRPEAHRLDSLRHHYREEICVIFTGCPIKVAGSAPAFGVNFCVRPPNVSAA
jgi:hypothetical protein